MPDPDLDQDAVDSQDRAETQDETHLNEDADDFTTLEEAPAAYDDTERDDDGDEDDDDPDAADADALDDRPDEYEPEVEWAEAVDTDEDAAESAVEDRRGADEIDGLDDVEDADSVEGGEDDFTNFQARRLSDAQLDELGYVGERDSKPQRRSS